MCELWERQKQCKFCYYERGEDIPVAVSESGEYIYEHEYLCMKGNNTDTDATCGDCREEEV